MDFLEKDLETIMYESHFKDILNRGLYHFEYDYLFRQVNLGLYGIADLISISRPNNSDIIITVYELKNNVLNQSAFWQIVRYIKGIRHILTWFDLRKHHIKINGVLVGRKVDTSGDFCFSPTIKSNISMYTYSYNINGIFFNIVRDSYTISDFMGIGWNQFGVNSGIGFFKSFLKRKKEIESEIEIESEPETETKNG